MPLAATHLPLAFGWSCQLPQRATNRPLVAAPGEGSSTGSGDGMLSEMRATPIHVVSIARCPCSAAFYVDQVIATPLAHRSRQQCRYLQTLRNAKHMKSVARSIKQGSSAEDKGVA